VAENPVDHEDADDILTREGRSLNDSRRGQPFDSYYPTYCYLINEGMFGAVKQKRLGR
jgi:hypothetical protein